MAVACARGALELALPVLALAGLVGCAAVAPPTAATESDREAYAQAVASLGRDPDQGRAALQAFLRERPRSTLADDAAVALAEWHLARGNEDEALQHLLFAVRRHPKGDRTDVARLHLARLQRERGHLQAAWRNASQIRLDVLTRDQRLESERLLADLAAERGDRVQRLLWLSRAREEERDPAELRRLDEELDGVVARMERGELADAARELGRREPAAKLYLRWAELALAEGDREEAKSALSRAAGLPLSPAAAERLAVLEGRLASVAPGPGILSRLPGPTEVPPAPAPDPARLTGTLGVVLPLSGPYASYGEECLEGILFATGMFGPRGAAPAGGLRLLVRDSRGTAEGAREAVRDLADTRDLVAILGPLLRLEADAAAEAAEREDVPLVAFTRREEIAYDRPHVFRTALTPGLEVDLLVDYALRDLGARRFAILHPKDDYGLRLRNLFWNAVEERGGDIVGVAGYDVDATDFAGPIRSLVGFTLLTQGQKAAIAKRKRLLDEAKRSTRERAVELRAEAAEVRGPGGEPLPPFVDFDALFIPDSHDNVALLAPQLAFHEVRGVRLLGPSGWDHPDLVRIARRHVDGAVFTSAFHRESRIPAVADFGRRFEATFGHPPESLSAEAYDATNLLLDQLARRREARRELREGLLEVRAVAGVTGVISIRADGNADKRPHLLGVQRGRIVSLDETGEPPTLRGAPARAGR